MEIKVTNEETGKMTLQIEDDFDLGKIADSGQCFRVRHFEDGTYRFITGCHVVYIQQIKEGKYTLRCDRNDWELVWANYFDLSRNYRDIRKSAKDRNDFVDRALTAGAGIRVLRQNTWEMLVTFIISQRKNIPAIAKAVETLSAQFGKKIETEYETVYAFPTPEELCLATQEELNACGLGYRTPYVRDAAEKVCSGVLDLSAIAGYRDQELFEELQKVHGVGKKVANCVCLFGYGRTSRVPVDVWIARALETECKGEDIFAGFGEDAGIIQQYIFYYERMFYSSHT